MYTVKCQIIAKQIFALFILMYMGLCFYACNDEIKEDFSNIPGVEDESWPSIVKCDSHSEVFVYTFKALNDWNVVSSEEWCEVLPTSGHKGDTYLKIVVDKNETELERAATITVNVENYKAVTFSLEQKKEQPEVDPDPALQMNLYIDDYLESYYLWNDEYESLSRDLTIPYVDFYENYLKTTLMSMTTNTLDKKKQIVDYDDYGKPIYGYSLYSYVDRIARSRASGNLDTSLGVNHGVKKTEEIKSFGFFRLDPLAIVDDEGYPTGAYKFVVQAVYPNSSASMFGVGRGTTITQIDGKEISRANYKSQYLNLLNPTKSNVRLLVEFPDSISEVILTTTMLDPTPILVKKVLEAGENRIGYLVYNGFDAAYDNDLLGVLAEFKSKNITDLVLDLRYNGGGHVISSNMLSSCLIGNGCKDKYFQYYRYNAKRMTDIEGTRKETGQTYDKSLGLFGEKYMYDDYYGVNLSPYSLDLKRLFVLTTKSTASASEALINSLRGFGILVTIIGEKTNGKNVGMESIQFNSEGYTYELAPITFQGYNVSKETVPSDGFSVDYAVADWDNGYVDFGDLNEPMLRKAYELIMGESRTIAPFVSPRKINGKLMHLPTFNRHPVGMIMLPK